VGGGRERREREKRREEGGGRGREEEEKREAKKKRERECRERDRKLIKGIGGEMEKRKARASRVDKGTAKLTSRDIVVFGWIAEQWLADLVQLGVLLGREAGRLPVTESTVRKRVLKWRQMGMVEYSSAMIELGFAPYVWLTAKGLKLLGTDYSYHMPAFTRVNHSLAVNNIRLALEHQFADEGVEWVSERFLKANEKPIPLPDGAAVIGGKRYAIEVELVRKSEKRYPELFRKHRRNGFARLWYYAAEEAIAAVARNVGKAEAGDFVKVISYEEAIDQLPKAEADSSYIGGRKVHA